jgi:hypothetical protein
MMIALSCITRNNPFDPINQKAQPIHPSGTITVSNKDTLIARVLNATAGDTIVVASGIYPVDLRFGNSGTSSQPIVLRGQDTSSIIRPQPGSGILYIGAQHSLRFSHLVFDSSISSGVKIENNSTDIVFDSCVFRNNQLDGLEAVDSDVLLNYCVCLRNTRAGIRVSGDATGHHTVTVNNALLAHNTQEGASINAAPAAIAHSTISDNGSNGIALTSPAGMVRLATSIISYNAGAAVSGQWDTTFAQIQLDSLDLFSNQQTVTLIPAVTPTFWTWNPLFIDHSAGNYSIGTQSELYTLQQQGIVIGYR